MKLFFLLLLFGFAAISCVSRSPQARDAQADTKLGLVKEEGGTEERDSALESLHRAQQQEQKRSLERQITE